MSTPDPADLANKKMNEIASLKRDAINDPIHAEAIWDRIEELKSELRELSPMCNNITQGLIASTLNPLMAQDTSLTSQGIDPRGS